MSTRRLNIGIAAFAATFLVATVPPACAQVASLNKGHQLMVDMGLQVWGCDTGGSDFNYPSLTGTNRKGDAIQWDAISNKSYFLS